LKVLVVEDEVKVRNFIERGFKERGVCVDTAADGQEAAFLAEGSHYDCIILDIMLPKLDGYELIARLRKKGNRTPVLFLTAKDTLEDKVRGFELGGDDYLVKPFSFAELFARVQALARRGRQEETGRLKAGGLEMDAAKRAVLRGAVKIELTPKEFALLQYLMERKGEVVTRTMLAENVWGYHFDSMSNVIDVHINGLRKKIDLPGGESLIHTLRGVGYVLEEDK